MLIVEIFLYEGKRRENCMKYFREILIRNSKEYLNKGEIYYVYRYEILIL